MIRTIASALVALALTLPLAAQEAPAALAPGEIVAAAAPQDWVRIAPEDLLVMKLAPAADGNARQVVIQLMPPPFSQGWIANIRTLARAGWYDGISINRVQDNYVVQWGDPNYDNPEADGPAKPLPEGLRAIGARDYTTSTLPMTGKFEDLLPRFLERFPAFAEKFPEIRHLSRAELGSSIRGSLNPDPYAEANLLVEGWPFGYDLKGGKAWPVHCYGMVGVGRGAAGSNRLDPRRERSSRGRATALRISLDRKRELRALCRGARQPARSLLHRARGRRGYLQHSGSGPERSDGVAILGPQG